VFDLRILWRWGVTLKTKSLCAALLVLTSSFPAFAELAGSEAAPSPARLEQLVEANIVAVHAYQMLLARKQQTMDLSCWPANAPKDANWKGWLRIRHLC
jgi:hypothetical protein